MLPVAVSLQRVLTSGILQLRFFEFRNIPLVGKFVAVRLCKSTPLWLAAHRPSFAPTFKLCLRVQLLQLVDISTSMASEAAASAGEPAWSDM